MIAVKGLTAGYAPEQPVLHGLSFTIQPGEIVSILGPNGSGKSTLLRSVLGLLPIKKGMVSIDGQCITRLSRTFLARIMAYVPQLHYGVFQYAVRDVVLMGRTASSPWYKVSPTDQEAAEHAMEKIRITHHAHKSYLELSGGERQMVLIARALAQGAKILVMDEPVTGLDYGNQLHLLEIIKTLSAEGLACLLTTHQPEHAVFLDGRSIMLKQGKVVDNGPSKQVVTLSSMADLYNLHQELLGRIIHL